MNLFQSCSTRAKGNLGTFSLLLVLSGCTQAIQKHSYGLVTGQARQLMSSEWDETNPLQVERAYCGTYGTVETHEAIVYGVKYATPALVFRATRSGVTVVCPRGTIIIHTHVPVTCITADDASCSIGGPLAYQCFPSIADLRVVQKRDPFTVIQCDRNAFVFAFRDRSK